LYLKAFSTGTVLYKNIKELLTQKSNAEVKKELGIASFLNKDFFYKYFKEAQDMTKVWKNFKEIANEQGWDKEWFADGLEQGLERGTSRGAYQKQLEAARKMIAKDCETNFIVEVTGLGVDEVLALKES